MAGFCRILASSDAVGRGRLVPPALGWGSMGLFDRGTLAYLTIRATACTGDAEIPVSELGVCAYGPDSGALARRVAGRIREWDGDGGQQTEVWIDAHPISAGDAPDARLVVDKRHTRIVVHTARSGQ
jgi:protein-L-isoaspartate(D-aspartate) O-methyltransferase